MGSHAKRGHDTNIRLVYALQSKASTLIKGETKGICFMHGLILGLILSLSFVTQAMATPISAPLERLQRTLRPDLDTLLFAAPAYKAVRPDVYKKIVDELERDVKVIASECDHLHRYQQKKNYASSTTMGVQTAREVLEEKAQIKDEVLARENIILLLSRTENHLVQSILKDINVWQKSVDGGTYAAPFYYAVISILTNTQRGIENIGEGLRKTVQEANYNQCSSQFKKILGVIYE